MLVDEQAPPAQGEQPVLPPEEIEPVADASAFYRFEKQIIELDRELRELSNAARQLGSSVGILSASFRLCERLGRILFLFRENAVVLFPHKVLRKTRELPVDRYWNFKRQRRIKRNRLLSMVARLSSSQDQPTPDELPDELCALARDIADLLDCFGQFPEFVDEVPEQKLEDDLKSWAEYLSDFSDDIETPAVRRYAHDLSVKVGNRLQRITNFIPSFIKVGIPTIRGAQKHSAGNLLNLSTVATLFSGVTATMIQFSFESNSNLTEDAVNAFWFTSLVFSISAAVNSLLGLSWMQAAFRSPEHRVPWWVLIWIKRSPLVFLVLSVACFFIGLVLFAYASEQNRVTAILTAVLSAACCFGLAALSVWFAFERWIFDWHRGNKLLSDVLHDLHENIMDTRFIAWSLSGLYTAIRWNRRLMMKGIPAWRLLKRRMSRLLYRPSSHSDPTSMSEVLEIPTYIMDPHPSPQDLEAQDTPGELPIRPPPGSRRGTLTGRDRFVEIVRRVIAMQQGTISRRLPTRTVPRISRRQISGVSDVSATLPIATKETLLPKLKDLGVVKQLDSHIALVRDLQFSPDGQLLATTSWDKQTKIFKIDDNFTLQRSLPHTAGFVSQIEWSPCGKMLLIKTNHVIRLWAGIESDIMKRSFVRKLPVESIKWLPNSEAFLSIEEDNIVKMDLQGNIMIRYTLEGMDVSDVAVTRDLKWMVCVGSILDTESKSPTEEVMGMNQIILYSLRTCTAEKRAPVFFEAADISLSSDDQSVLVSFENKAAPQLWKLHTENEKAPLVLRHSFPSAGRPEFAMLPSIFGGEDDTLVLRAEIGGNVHIWDRDTATLLHIVHGPPGIGHLTSLAWNASTSTLMFATGSHDGAVNIWTVNSTPGREPISRGHHTPTMDLTHSPTSMTSSYRRMASPSPFNIGYRSESPTMQFGEDDEHSEVLDAHSLSRRMRRSTTFS